MRALYCISTLAHGVVDFAWRRRGSALIASAVIASLLIASVAERGAAARAACEFEGMDSAVVHEIVMRAPSQRD